MIRNRVQIESCGIDSIGYDSKLQQLEIGFKTPITRPYKTDGGYLVEAKMPIYRYYDVPEEIFKLILDPKLRDSFLKKHTKNGYLFLPFRYERVGDVYTKDRKNYTDVYYEVRKQERSENKGASYKEAYLASFRQLKNSQSKKTTEEIAYSGYTGTAVYTVMNQIQALLNLNRKDDAVKRAMQYFSKASYDPYYPSSPEVARVFKHAQFEMEAKRKLSENEVDKILQGYEAERGGRLIKKNNELWPGTPLEKDCTHTTWYFVSGGVKKISSNNYTIHSSHDDGGTGNTYHTTSEKCSCENKMCYHILTAQIAEQLENDSDEIILKFFAGLTYFTPNFEAIQKFGFDKQKILKKRFKDNLELWMKDKKQTDFYEDYMLPERRFIFSDKFLYFEKAREFVRKLGLKTNDSWEKYCMSGKKPDNIPNNCEDVYKDFGWKGWKDWFGVKSFEFLPYEEARKIVRGWNLQTQAEWNLRCITSDIPNNIPKNPNRIYKEDWEGWRDWLKETAAKKSLNYLPFAKARIISRKLGLSSVVQWNSFAETRKRPDNIPKNPYKIYKEDWEGWKDWLGIESFEFLPYQEARKIVRKLKLVKTDQEDVLLHSVWKKYAKSDKRPKNIPFNPSYIYDHTDNNRWKGMANWLGVRNLHLDDQP